MNEKNIERLLRLENGPANDNESKNDDSANNEFEYDESGMDYTIQKKIKKGIRKQIYTQVTIMLVIAALIFAGGTLGISLLLNAGSYNPRKSSPALTEDGEYYDFHLLMSTFLGLYYSDISYVPVLENSKAKGFGSYDVTVKIQSSFDPLYIDGYSNTTFHVNRSTLSADTSESRILSIQANEFYNTADTDNSYFSDLASVTPELIKEIEELPDSTILNVSLSFGENRSLEDAIAFMEKYDSADFVWLAVNMNGSVADGIDLGYTIGYTLTEDTQNEYPNLLLNDELSEESLTQSYLSRLKLLMDHTDFLSLLYKLYGTHMTLPHIRDQYEKVTENGLNAIGLRAYVKKQDLLTMIEEDEISYIIVNDIKLSSLQR